jgi:hypothetical protein
MIVMLVAPSAVSKGRNAVAAEFMILLARDALVAHDVAALIG